MDYVIPNNNPDWKCRVDIGEVTDADGEVLPDEAVTLEFLSSDQEVLQVTVDETGRAADLHPGHSGQAAYTVNAKGPDGTILATGSDNFTLTQGPPNAVSGIKITHEGLTPVEPAP